MSHNFDYTLETKVRALLAEILDPLKNRLVSLTQDVQRIDQQQVNHQNQISIQGSQIAKQDIFREQISKAVSELELKHQFLQEKHLEIFTSQGLQNQKALEDQLDFAERLNETARKVEAMSKNLTSAETELKLHQEQINQNFEQVNKRINNCYSQNNQDTYQLKTLVDNMSQKVTMLSKQQEEVSAITQSFGNSFETMKSLKEQKEIINNQFMELLEITITKEQFALQWQELNQQIDKELRQFNTRISQINQQALNDKKDLLQQVQQVQLDKNNILKQLNVQQHSIKDQQLQISQYLAQMDKRLEDSQLAERELEGHFDSKFETLLQATEEYKKEHALIKSNLKKQAIKFEDKFERWTSENQFELQKKLASFQQKLEEDINSVLLRECQHLQDVISSVKPLPEKELNHLEPALRTLKEEHAVSSSSESMLGLTEKVVNLQHYVQKYETANSEVEKLLTSLDQELKKQQLQLKKVQDRVEFFVLQTKSYLKKYIEKESDDIPSNKLLTNVLQFQTLNHSAGNDLLQTENTPKQNEIISHKASPITSEQKNEGPMSSQPADAQQQTPNTDAYKHSQFESGKQVVLGPSLTLPSKQIPTNTDQQQSQPEGISAPSSQFLITEIAQLSLEKGGPPPQKVDGQAHSKKRMSSFASTQLQNQSHLLPLQKAQTTHDSALFGLPSQFGQKDLKQRVDEIQIILEQQRNSIFANLEANRAQIIKLHSDLINEMNYVGGQIKHLMKFKENQITKTQDMGQQVELFLDALTLTMIIDLHNELIEQGSEHLKISAKKCYEYIPGQADEQTHIFYASQKQSKIEILVSQLKEINRRRGIQLERKQIPQIKKPKCPSEINQTKPSSLPQRIPIEATRGTIARHMTVAMSQRLISRRCKTTNSESLRAELDGVDFSITPKKQKQKSAKLKLKL